MFDFTQAMPETDVADFLEHLNGSSAPPDDSLALARGIDTHAGYALGQLHLQFRHQLGYEAPAECEMATLAIGSEKLCLYVSTGTFQSCLAALGFDDDLSLAEPAEISAVADYIFAKPITRVQQLLGTSVQLVEYELHAVTPEALPILAFSVHGLLDTDAQVLLDGPESCLTRLLKVFQSTEPPQEDTIEDQFHASIRTGVIRAKRTDLAGFEVGAGFLAPADWHTGADAELWLSGHLIALGSCDSTTEVFQLQGPPSFPDLTTSDSSDKTTSRLEQDTVSLSVAFGTADISREGLFALDDDSQVTVTTNRDQAYHLLVNGETFAKVELIQLGAFTGVRFLSRL